LKNANCDALQLEYRLSYEASNALAYKHLTISQPAYEISKQYDNVQLTDNLAFSS